MAVGRRLNSYSGMRLDIPHLRSIESASSYDFDSLLRGMFTGLNQPYLIRGFKLVIPQSTTESQNLTIQVADSAVLHSSASESGTILLTPPGIPNEQLSSGANPKVIGSFLPNAVNYVSLDYRRVVDTNTVDQTAGWSPSQQLEFQRSVPIGRILEYRFVISTSGFSTNLPLYTIFIDSSNNFVWATKAVPSLFRLGSGGANPNPQNTFKWGNYNNTQSTNPRKEWINEDSNLNSNPLTVGTNAPSDAFDYGDFSITNFKEWMDAVMTRVKEITGSDYWYTDSRMTETNPNAFTTWWDSVGSVMTGAGEISYNLVLESSAPSDGKFQQQALDLEIKTGDLYVQGVTSGTKATLTSYNNTQLMINSMTSAAFSYGETLHSRRVYRPLSSQWGIDNFDFGGSKYGRLYRKPVTLGSSASVSSWTFSSKSANNTNLYSSVTITTSSNHGFNVGDTVYLQGLTLSTGNAPNGAFRVSSVPALNQFKFNTGLYLDPIGTPGSSGSAALADSVVKNPYTPYRKMLTDEADRYQTNGGTQVKIGIEEHNFVTPQSLTTSMTLNSKTLVLSSSDVAKIKIGMRVVHANLPSNTVVVSKPSTTSILVSEKATATASSVAVTYKDLIIVSGVTATGYTDKQLNGTFTVEGLTANGIIIDLGITGPAASVVNTINGIVEPIVYQSVMTVSGVNQPDYNVININSNVIGGDDLVYLIGPDSLPPLDPATGTISLDGIIATSIVLNPVLVQTINYNHTTKVITVTTFSNHGLSTSSNVNFTIYGNQAVTIYARTYKNVNIGYVNATTYTLTGGDVNNVFTASGSYTNSGSDKIFSKFADNPYAGPVAWSSDIVVKGIIGEIGFTIPKTATIDITDLNKDSVIANNFNINGVTGTAYLQDGEVLYAKLERNKIASNGAIITTNGANALISTVDWLSDENDVPLEVGDWIKWQDEEENKWLKIKTISQTSVTLETDNNQEPDLIQRPPKTGVIVYSKGTYSKLYVRKHINVDLSSDVYWIAVRRDNAGSKAKVYFKSLEVEAGEVRQVNDNQNSNILTYIGAANEGSTNPNYTASGDGDFSFTKSLQVEATDAMTRMVTFATGPERGFQINDVILNPITSQYYTVTNVISSRTVIIKEDISSLTVSTTVQYQRVNQHIDDQDNLTLAIRKEDRNAGHIETALKRPVYDESIYIQKINISGSGTIRSGSYIYTGTLSNPTALAWVLHGSSAVTETIEGSSVVMPGGHSSIGSSSILVHIYFGIFSNGDGINQNGSSTGATIDNAGNPPFDAPSLFGADIGGIEMVLPPNRRTQVLGSGYVVWGTHAYYKQSDDPIYAGEELLVIVNDGIRQASIDYKETFGGPKGKIQIVRTTPPNTRMRFRIQSSFGSAVMAKSADASLQSAYNVGATILASPNRPVQITASDTASGEVGQIIRGSLAVNGGTNQLGGIFNEGTVDQGFVIGKEINKPKETWTGLDAVKTHSSHPDSAWKRATSAQTVTGDAATVITNSAIQLVEGQAYRIKMNAIARRSDGTMGVSSIVLEGTFYMSGGTVYAAGSPVSIINGFSGDGYNYAAAFGIQGTTVVLVVYGTSGSTIQWAVGMDWQAVGLS